MNFPLNVVVVGHGGGMGRTVYEELRSTPGAKEYIKSLRGYDINVNPNEAAKAFDGVNVVVYAVPIRALKDAITLTKPYIDTEVMVTDILSVKMYAAEVIAEAFPSNSYIGLHPLFGPKTSPVFHAKAEDLENRHIAVCSNSSDCGEGVVLEFVEFFSHLLKLKVVRCTAHTHDYQMAETQVMSHFVGKAGQIEGTFHRQVAMPTTSSAKLIEISKAVNLMKPELYEDIQIYNPYAADMRSSLIDTLTEENKRIKELAEVAAKENETLSNL